MSNEPRIDPLNGDPGCERKNRETYKDVDHIHTKLEGIGCNKSDELIHILSYLYSSIGYLFIFSIRLSFLYVYIEIQFVVTFRRQR